MRQRRQQPDPLQPAPHTGSVGTWQHWQWQTPEQGKGVPGSQDQPPARGGLPIEVKCLRPCGCIVKERLKQLKFVHRNHGYKLKLEYHTFDGTLLLFVLR